MTNGNVCICMFQNGLQQGIITLESTGDDGEFDDNVESII